MPPFDDSGQGIESHVPWFAQHDQRPIPAPDTMRHETFTNPAAGPRLAVHVPRSALFLQLVADEPSKHMNKDGIQFFGR